MSKPNPSSQDEFSTVTLQEPRHSRPIKRTITVLIPITKITGGDYTSEGNELILSPTPINLIRDINGYVALVERTIRITTNSPNGIEPYNYGEIVYLNSELVTP
jgi:hypothetical protein